MVLENLRKPPTPEPLGPESYGSVEYPYLPSGVQSQGTYVYWVHLKGQFENSCCLENNPSLPTTAGFYVFTLKSAPDPKGYEGVVCSPNCDGSVIWSGPVEFAQNTLMLTSSGPEIYD